MKLYPTLFILASTAALASASCTRMGYVHLNFYGYPDNSSPSGDTAYDCGGRNHVAGGTGAYNDPVTFASAEGEFNECEVVYIPYIEKYARYEDYCAQCTIDYASNVRHLSIWTGSSQASLNGGEDQKECEALLTPNHTITIIRRPDSTYPVDILPFYKKGGAVTPTPSPSSSPSPSPDPGSDESGGSLGNRTTFVVNVTVNVSVNMIGKKRDRRARRHEDVWLKRRTEGSCNGNLYPDNDATKICTT